MGISINAKNAQKAMLQTIEVKILKKFVATIGSAASAQKE